MARGRLYRSLHQSLQNLEVVSQPRVGRSAPARVVLLDDILQSMLKSAKGNGGFIFFGLLSVALSVVLQRGLFGDFIAYLATNLELQRDDFIIVVLPKPLALTGRFFGKGGS